MVEPRREVEPIPVYADIMVPVYAIALLAGFLMLLAWIVARVFGPDAA